MCGVDVPIDGSREAMQELERLLGIPLLEESSRL